MKENGRCRYPGHRRLDVDLHPLRLLLCVSPVRVLYIFSEWAWGHLLGTGLKDSGLGTEACIEACGQDVGEHLNGGRWLATRCQVIEICHVVQHVSQVEWQAVGGTRGAAQQRRHLVGHLAAALQTHRSAPCTTTMPCCEPHQHLLATVSRCWRNTGVVFRSSSERKIGCSELVSSNATDCNCCSTDTSHSPGMLNRQRAVKCRLQRVVRA